MTDTLKELLQKHLAALDREAPDYPLLEKCYQALNVVYIPPEADKYMVEWAEEFGDDSDLLTMMRKYWLFEHKGADTIPSVAVGFVRAFYNDHRMIRLVGRVENEYGDFIDSLRGKDFHAIIDAAHEIDMKNQIFKFLTDEENKLDIEDIDLLMTLEHPMARLYEACQAQDAIREAVEYSLDRVTRQQKSYLQTAPDTADEDVQIFRARYLSDREEVPFPAVSQMREQLIARAEQDRDSAIDGPPLPPEHVVRLHSAMTFIQEGGYTPVEAAVMRTYDHPLTEVLERMEQGGLPVEFAFHCAVADRQVEMQQYIDRLDSLPAPLQKSVREYQEQLTAAEVFSAIDPAIQPEQEWETEER